MTRRTRVYATAAAAAALAVAAALAAALLAGDDRPARSRPPLELALLSSSSPQVRTLQAAELAYEQGQVVQARRLFAAALARDPRSVEAAVGAAVAAWPDGTRERLEALAAAHPDRAVVGLHLGLVLYLEGDRAQAERLWRLAKAREPDSLAAIEAETLLHPDQAPARPVFIASAPFPQELADLPADRLLATLAGRARRANDVQSWLRYGVALQRVGRPLSARRAYDRAVELAPNDPQARVAAAVVRYDKDRPAQAFGLLGPLIRSYPRAAVVRFHLGLLLLWLRRVEQARPQLEQARRLAPKSIYGRSAADLLERLDAHRE